MPVFFGPHSTPGLIQETAWASRPDTHRDKSVLEHLWDFRALLHRIVGGVMGCRRKAFCDHIWHVGRKGSKMEDLARRE